MGFFHFIPFLYPPYYRFSRHLDLTEILLLHAGRQYLPCHRLTPLQTRPGVHPTFKDQAAEDGARPVPRRWPDIEGKLKCFPLSSLSLILTMTQVINPVGNCSKCRRRRSQRGHFPPR